MIRSFLPAGQGNFAVEKFENGESVVFDCGATNISIARQLINNTFQKKENILAVFISHLDIDHINGLEYLLQHCAVKEIYIPFLDSGGKLLTAIEEAAFHGRKLSDFALRFLRNPEEAVGSIPGKPADLNETRFLNIFIRKRVSSYVSALAAQGFPFFLSIRTFQKNRKM